MPFDDYPEDRGFRYLVAFVYSVVVAILWIPAAVLRRIRGAWREVGTEGWPRAEGTITSVDVKVIHGWLVDYAIGHLDYGYRVHGEYYSGHFVRQFADEQAAWDFVDARRDQPIMIRHKDDDAELSILGSSDQMALAGETSAPLSSQVWRHWRDLLRRETREETDEDFVPGEPEEEDGVGITTGRERPLT